MHLCCLRLGSQRRQPRPCAQVIKYDRCKLQAERGRNGNPSPTRVEGCGRGTVVAIVEMDIEARNEFERGDESGLGVLPFFVNPVELVTGALWRVGGQPGGAGVPAARHGALENVSPHLRFTGQTASGRGQFFQFPEMEQGDHFGVRHSRQLPMRPPAALTETLFRLQAIPKTGAPQAVVDAHEAERQMRQRSKVRGFDSLRCLSHLAE